MRQLTYSADSATWRPFLRQCYEVAQQSHDPKTQNGALLLSCLSPSSYVKVLATGCNRFPGNIKPTPENLAPVVKDKLILHAEEAVLLTAAKAGDRTDGAVMVSCWAPCLPCAKSILAAGIGTLVSHQAMHDRTYEKYRDEIEQAVQHLLDHGVQVIRYTGQIGEGTTNIMNNETWYP